MAILSIQSWVAYGHVGNAVASFALQRLGMEVWAANTVNFSNHPGYGQWRGERAGGPAVTALVDGVASLGVLGQCEAVLSGYLGSADMAAAVLHAASLVRAANPAALYCCDPVIGDTAPGIYVEGAIPAFLRDRCLPAADILTPNHFELGFLSGRPVTSLAAAKDAANHLRHAMRPGGIVLVTSLLTPQTPAGAIDLLVVDATGSHRLRTPLLPFGPSGAGDLVAALFLFQILRGATAPAAMAAAAAAVFGVLRHTIDTGSRELALVAAQHELVSPSACFTPVSC